MSCVVQGALDERCAQENEKTNKQESLFVTTDKSVLAHAEISTDKTDVTDVTNVTTYITTLVKKVTTPVVSTTPQVQTSPVTTVETKVTETIAATEAVPITEPPVEQQPPVENPTPSVPVSPGYSVPEAAGVDASYLEKCAFIGDSHIKGLSGYGIVSDSRVFAQNGLSLAHLSEKIKASDVQSVNPENIYIMMGTNGVMWADWNDMIQKYKDFTNSLVQAMPGARIYILSIPPVTAQRESKADVQSGKYLNSDIDGYNKKLLDMAKENGWYYVDVNSALKDGNGYLGSSTDGVHMSKDLYSTFKNYILTHVVS